MRNSKATQKAAQGGRKVGTFRFSVITSEVYAKNRSSLRGRCRGRGTPGRGGLKEIDRENSDEWFQWVPETCSDSYKIISCRQEHESPSEKPRGGSAILEGEQQSQASGDAEKTIAQLAAKFGQGRSLHRMRHAYPIEIKALQGDSQVVFAVRREVCVSLHPLLLHILNFA